MFDRLVSLLRRLGRFLRGLVTRARHPFTGRWLYADDTVRMDAAGLLIPRYYWPVGFKRIPYERIERYHVRALTLWRGQYRVHGIDVRGRWYSRDKARQHKELAIVLETGGRIRPVITPSDPQAVLDILHDHT